jgi:uncharacterized membrane protein
MGMESAKEGRADRRDDVADDKTHPHASAPREGSALIPDHVARNVQAVMEMHLQAERDIGAHQRAIESGTARLGRPASLYAIVLAVFFWAVLNAFAPRVGLRALDPPPFVWLQGVIGLAALLTAAMVLITQNRQAKLIERRMHLDLQVNLLTEQKTAKLIELLEELRRDLPNVRNRRDSEAEVMQHSAEPHQVIAALEQQTVDALRAEGEIIAAADAQNVPTAVDPGDPRP